jgi:hypothetical protein
MSADPRRQMLVRTWNGVRFVLSVMLLCPMNGYGQSGPQPPCATAHGPTNPALNDSVIVKSWRKSDFASDWKPPACTGWVEVGFGTLVTTAARFRPSSEAEGLLRHVGAISELAGTRYWSTTHQRWQPFILDAYALTGPQSGQRRKDFSPDEMKAGTALYFEQVDNLAGKAIYRIRIDEESPNRIVFDVENVSVMRHLLVPIFRPGEMQAIYFLDRETDNVWRYYSMVRTGRNTSRLAGNESSAINRAVALYRRFVGIPTDQEPPAAP